MAFILINAFFVVISILGLIVLWWVWPPDSPWSPWWRTSGKKAIKACELADIDDKDIVYELGSGDATFLVMASKKFGATGVGVEIDLLRHLTGKLNVLINGVSKKITLKKRNFFKEDLNRASVVFVYLVPRVLEKLKPKLFSELKKGTKIISYKYKFKINGKEPMRLVGEDKENEFYLYKIVS